MGKRFVVASAVALIVLARVAPVHAQEAAAGVNRSTVAQWSIITAGFALAFAAAFGALGQAKGLSAAVEGIARNPSAAGEIRGNLILGLITASLQAFIFVLLTTIYLGGAVATEHEHHEHGEMIAGEV